MRSRAVKKASVSFAARNFVRPWRWWTGGKPLPGSLLHSLMRDLLVPYRSTICVESTRPSAPDMIPFAYQWVVPAPGRAHMFDNT